MSAWEKCATKSLFPLVIAEFYESTILCRELWKNACLKAKDIRHSHTIPLVSADTRDGMLLSPAMWHCRWRWGSVDIICPFLPFDTSPSFPGSLRRSSVAMNDCAMSFLYVYRAYTQLSSSNSLFKGSNRGSVSPCCLMLQPCVDKSRSVVDSPTISFGRRTLL